MSEQGQQQVSLEEMRAHLRRAMRTFIVRRFKVESGEPGLESLTVHGHFVQMNESGTALLVMERVVDPDVGPMVKATQGFNAWYDFTEVTSVAVVRPFGLVQ